MPRGARQAAFGAAAAADGVTLETPSKVPWLTRRGHLALPEQSRARTVLDGIFDALDGDLGAQASKALTLLKGDFIHPSSGVLIEVDEYQHFTSHRQLTLDYYPGDIRVGFDVEVYRDHCRQWSAKADRAYAHRTAAGFGPRGRPRQRAYVDALRDLATSMAGHPPVIRAAAIDQDGAAAYARVRDLVRDATMRR